MKIQNKFQEKKSVNNLLNQKVDEMQKGEKCKRKLYLFT